MTSCLTLSPGSQGTGRVQGSLGAGSADALGGGLVVMSTELSVVAVESEEECSDYAKHTCYLAVENKKTIAVI